MTYAQKDYDQIQGNNGVNTIAEIGSLLTAFANLLTRFGHGVDPAMLDSVFKEDGVYLHEDDEVRDKLAYTSISAYDSTVGPSGIGIGVPTVKDAIVRMDYFSKLLNKDVSTYALVEDNIAGTIIDSFDGEVKSWDVYGGPKEYVEYKRYEAIEVSPLKTAAPVINMTDTAPEPVIEAPVESPSTLETYEVAEDVQGWHFFENASAGDPTDILVNKGTYFVKGTSPKKGLIFIVPTVESDGGAWLSNTDEGEKVPVRVIKTDPDAWKSTFELNPNDEIDAFVTTADIDVINYDNPTETIHVATDTIIPVAGQFVKDHITYGRTQSSIASGKWFGVPMTELKRDGEDDAEFDKHLEEIYKTDSEDTIDLGIDDEQTAKDKVIKAAATTEGKLEKLTSAFKLKRK